MDYMEKLNTLMGVQWPWLSQAIEILYMFIFIPFVIND